MNWENSVVKINIISKDIEFNHPLNTTGTTRSSGTGFFITPNLILTCYHVVKFAINVDILYKQNININGKIKYIFPDDDLAIIEIITQLDDVIPLNLKVINTRNIGDVYTIGFPLSSVNIKITKGIISGYQGSLIQTDASLNHGNSGGPLVIKENDQYYVIGVNVSKVSGNAERTGFVVPIYRFIISQQLINTNTNIAIPKPKWNFYYQKLIQSKLIETLYGLNIDSENKQIRNFYIKKKIGVRITIINNDNYLSKHFKVNDIIISINGKYVDYNGRIKFDFYPEKINLNDIYLWFNHDQTISVKIFDPNTLNERIEDITLNNSSTNLLQYYSIDGYPEYFVENNGLILSILSDEHIEDIKKLDLSFNQLIKIINRRIYCSDLFTIYLADYNFSKNNQFVKYPIGEIIIEINDSKFNNYNEFINLTKQPITKIKTIDNEIFFI